MKIIKTTVFIFACIICICFAACKEEPIAVPLITSIFPARAKVDTVITITGVNFSSTPGGNNVTINGVRCIILSESSTTIKIKTVAGISTGKIAVTVDRLTAFSSEFKVIPHKFVFEPLEGKPGDEVLFTGTYFPEDTFKVRLYFYDSARSFITTFIKVNDSISTFKAIVPDSALTGNISISVGPLLIDSDSIYTVIPK